jgi:HEAT repeat protein
MLTAVFAMSRVPGFDDQILEALEHTDPEIHMEAVNSAGVRELNAAWPHVVAFIEAPSTPKLLLLAAIEAVGNIRPKEAAEILADLANSPDEEIAEVASETISMAQALSGDADENVNEDGEWIN